MNEEARDKAAHLDFWSSPVEPMKNFNRCFEHLKI